MSDFITGPSLIRTLMKSNGGTYLLNTTTQTVSGVARISPTGPHNHVQNATAIRSPTSETPALSPYSQGSRIILATSSNARKTASTRAGHIHPSKTITLRALGMIAAAQGPT